MRHIRKGAEPQELADARAAVPRGQTPNWRALRGEPKAAVKAALLSEQRHVCAYCERAVWTRDSHIDHLEPQHRDHDRLTFNYANLLVSCGRDEERAARHPTCGIPKQDQLLTVHPLVPNCSAHFSYSSAGGIAAAGPAAAAARETIRVLALDDRSLVALRRVALRVVDELLPPLTGDDAADAAALAAALTVELDDAEALAPPGRRRAFSSSVAQYVRRLLP